MPADALVIVEDDMVLREELKVFFVSHGFVVHEANGESGLFDVLQEHRVQVVVLDLNLPGKNGYAIAERLKQSMPQLGIVMLTARTSLQDRVKGYEVGADLYLPKPTDPMELLAAIRRMIERAAAASSGSDNAWVLKTRYGSLAKADCICRDLTPVESTIVRALALAPMRTLDIGDLLNLLEERFPARVASRRALENILSRLRKKLMTCFEGEPDPVKSIRSTGYQLVWVVEVHDD